MNILLVALGGAIGALLRYGVMNLSIALRLIQFPYGTLTVNVIGSFLISLIAFLLLDKSSALESLRIFLIIGVLGAFTTFSSFSLDTLHLFLQHRYFAAGSYICLSFILCIIAVFAGMGAAKIIQ